MKRWLLNLAACVSLALCALSAVIWTMSYVDGLWFRLVRPTSDVSVRFLFATSLSGQLELETIRMTLLPRSVFPEHPDPVQVEYREEMGLQFGRIGKSWPTGVQIGVFPQQTVGHGFACSYANFTPETASAIGMHNVGHRLDGSMLISIPHWSAFGLTGLLPVLWIVTFRRSRAKIRQGFCATCGYDLRATPDLCPECGTECNRRDTEAAEK